MAMARSGERAGNGVPCMAGGSGEHSYANNSSPQNYVFHAYFRPHLSEALTRLCSSPTIFSSLAQAITESPTSAPPPTTPPRLTIADLGCAHGRNALDYASFILQGLKSRLVNSFSSPNASIEMQYLFCDLPDNNFNSLFQSLPGFLQEIDDGTDSACDIFTGAVAGSFHGPLFPTGSLHFAMSAISLHWLSQVPPEVTDKSSPAWNGGSVWLHGQKPRVVEAFASRFQQDMRGFFQNRARELVKGGVLFLLFPCRAELHPVGSFSGPWADLWSGFFQTTWMDMVREGVISEEEGDLFNIPFYKCHESELHKLLDEFCGVLEVVKMEVMTNCRGMSEEDEQSLLEDSKAFGKFWATFVASVMRPMVEAHLGEGKSIEFFKRLETLICNKASQSTFETSNVLVAIIQKL